MLCVGRRHSQLDQAPMRPSSVQSAAALILDCGQVYYKVGGVFITLLGWWVWEWREKHGGCAGPQNFSVWEFGRVDDILFSWLSVSGERWGNLLTQSALSCEKDFRHRSFPSLREQV